jgi:UDPglucose 6-dehydrogenase
VVDYSKDRYEALIDSDALVVITEWPEFRLLNYKVMEKLMKNKVIFDGRNIYDPSEMKEYGFICYGIGRRNL